MGIAFRTNSAQITVGQGEQLMQDFVVGWYEWNCAAIEGFVTDQLTGEPVNCALVKAVSENASYLGITDQNGFYAICVPPGEYDVFVLCCEDCFTKTTGTCGPCPEEAPNP